MPLVYIRQLRATFATLATFPPEFYGRETWTNVQLETGCGKYIFAQKTILPRRSTSAVGSLAETEPSNCAFTARRGTL
jgi:hypothetical protein